MPYIVTTKRPSEIDCMMITRSRRAVATLDEALEHVSTTVCGLMAGENFGQYQDEFRAIDERGGTVGPLPDGTAIEIEQISPLMLAAQITGDKAGLGALMRGCLDRDDWSDLIDTFNEQAGAR
jgi:hypothetical protein